MDPSKYLPYLFPPRFPFRTFSFPLSGYECGGFPAAGAIFFSPRKDIMNNPFRNHMQGSERKKEHTRDEVERDGGGFLDEGVNNETARGVDSESGRLMR